MSRRARAASAHPSPATAATPPAAVSPAVPLVRVDSLRPSDGASSCLRPLGLCELGGACDACWYNPAHPRFHREGR